MSWFTRLRSRRRLSRTVLSLALVAGLLVLACDLDNGKEFDLPTDPSVIPDVTNVSLAVSIDPGNVPADGESYSTIFARVLNDGVPLPGVPILFYSEWGTVFTACGTPTTVSLADFSQAIITGPDGVASTLVQAPVLPNLYHNEQESNTIAAFALIDGVIVRAINNQNLWQVDFDGVSCQRRGSRIVLTARYAGRGIYPVSGCANVEWTATSRGLIVSEPTLCTEHGTTTATVEFDANDPPVPSTGTVQVTASFNGSGLNECVLDEDRSISITAAIQVNRTGSPVCVVH